MTFSKWVSLGCGSYRRIRTGVYEVNYRPHGAAGKQVRRQIAATEDEIKDLIVDASRNRSRSQSGIPVDVSWLQAETLYRLHIEAKGTTEDYREKVFKLIETLKTETKADSPAAVDVIVFENWLNGLAKKAQAAKRPGWARTANKKKTMLHGFFRFLVRRRLVSSNPTEAVDSFRETKRPPRALTPEEYAKVWKVCENPVRDLLDFLLLTGCRFGEAAAMRFTDVENEVWTCAKRKSRDYFRQVLPPIVLEIIARRERLPDGLVWHKESTRNGGKGGHGFNAWEPIEQRWLYDLIQARCKVAGVNRFRIHDLRHAAASWAAAAGASPWALKAHLGHSALSTTERYSHPQSGSNVGAEFLTSIREKALQSQGIR